MYLYMMYTNTHSFTPVFLVNYVLIESIIKQTNKNLLKYIHQHMWHAVKSSVSQAFGLCEGLYILLIFFNNNNTNNSIIVHYFCNFGIFVLWKYLTSFLKDNNALNAYSWYIVHTLYLILIAISDRHPWNKELQLFTHQQYFLSSY